MAQVPFPAPGPGGGEPSLPGAAGRDGQPGNECPARSGQPENESPAPGGQPGDPAPTRVSQPGKADPARDRAPGDATPARDGMFPDDAGRDGRPADDPAGNAPVPTTEAAGGTADGSDDGFDAAADMARMLDDIESGVIEIPSEDELAPPVMFALGETADVDPAELAAMAGPGGIGGHVFSQYQAADAMRPGPLLSVLTEQAAGDPAGLGDDALLGMVSAARRLSNRARYLELSGIAEFGRRRAAQYAASVAAKARPGRRAGEFADDELGFELVMNRHAAGDRMELAASLATRLPCTRAALAAGLIDDDRAAVIWSYTRFLSDADAAHADAILAAAAPGLRYEQLTGKAYRLEIKLDPQGVEQRREEARRKGRRVETRREQSGNMAFGGRELSVAEALAAKAFNDADALALRAAGMPGSLQDLRVLALLDRARGLNPLDRLTGNATGATDNGTPARGTDGTGAGIPDGSIPGGGIHDGDNSEDANGEGHTGSARDPHRNDSANGGQDGTAAGHGDPAGRHGRHDQNDSYHDGDDHGKDGNDGSHGDDRHGHGYGDEDGYGYDGDEDRGDDEDGDHGDDGEAGYGGEDDPEGPGGGGPGDSGPAGGSGGSGGAGVPAPFPALINLLVPAGTLLGWSTAAGEAGSWGLLDPADTRGLVTAASQHPRTRWCITATGTDGIAIAHGCARGQHPWTPGQDQYPWTPGQDQYQRVQLADLLRALNATLTPIARGPCDHSQAENRYTPGRALQHLIRARTDRCAAPGCGTQAANCDIDHTLAYPGGPTEQCNLSPACRHHHRAKQAPGWHLDQPEPGRMRWTTPSGRSYVTTPTAYDT